MTLKDAEQQIARALIHYVNLQRVEVNSRGLAEIVTVTSHDTRVINEAWNVILAALPKPPSPPTPPPTPEKPPGDKSQAAEQN